MYVVVTEGGREIILDPVHDRFDEEVPYLDKLDIDMNLEILNGTPRVGDADEIASLNGGLGYLVSKQERERGTGRSSVDIARQKAREAGLTMAQYEARKRAEYIAKWGYPPEDAGKQTQKIIAEAKRRAEEQRRLEEANRDPVKSKWSDRVAKIVPVTALMRAGIRLWLRKDMRVPMGGKGGGLASRLAPALLPVNTARNVFADMNQWGALRAVFERLRTSYVRAGGKESEFVAAIKAGAGNQAAGVALSGLGEPGTATAIATATAVITAIGALLKNVGQLKLQQGKDPGKVVETAIRVADAGEAAGKEWTDPTPVLPPATIPEEVIPLTPKEDKKPVSWGTIGLVGGLGLGLLGGGYYLYRQLGKKKKGRTGKPLNGAPKKKTNTNKPKSKTKGGYSIEFLNGTEAIALPQ